MKTSAVGCLGAIFVVFLFFGLGFRVDTNKRVDRFTADYIHGGYRILLSNRCFTGSRTPEQPASCALFYTLKSFGDCR